MEYNVVKQILLTCPDLGDLDEASRATLLLRGNEETPTAGAIIYAEYARLDDTFCMLLSGDLVIEKAGVEMGQISGNQIFGEMAYFTKLNQRTATVRVSSPQASFLKFQLTHTELDSPLVSALRKDLGLQAWERFVSGSQSRP
jgi:hypothetical protein